MKSKNKDLIIAIDGYSACGKSTFAKAIAKELRYTYIDSGAMYRAVTLYCLNNEIIQANLVDLKELKSKLPNINIEFKFNHKLIRAKFVEIQRNLSTNKRVVMDGRDIGSVVFPNADIKIFLTASVAVRARRRYDEMISKGLDVSFQDVEKNITERDYIDENRDISPLTKALDAIILDNSNMNVDEQMEWFKEIYNKVQGE